MLTERNFALFFEKIGPGVALSDNAASALSVMTDAKVRKTKMGLRGDADPVATFPRCLNSRIYTNFSEFVKK